MNPERTDYIPRLLKCPNRSFFLFGPRGVGKSTMLRQVLPEALHLDLLDASLYLELSRDPHRLEAIIGHRPRGAWIVLDEIQKAPGLLDEVHRLMESRRWRFALCGSSARKLRRVPARPQAIHPGNQRTSHKCNNYVNITILGLPSMNLN
ncbi:MAG: AAA family ATPase [Desulfomonile sp.]